MSSRRWPTVLPEAGREAVGQQRPWVRQFAITPMNLTGRETENVQFHPQWGILLSRPWVK